MRLIERYVLRRLTVTFLFTLIALAGVVWTTQALRQMNLVTAKGQTLLVFLEISALAIPYLLLVVAPFALLVAVVQVLNALNADSEMVVLAASGGSRFIVLRPILVFTVTLALVMAFAGSFIVPAAQRVLRGETTKINVDLIANIVRPGRFTEIEPGLTFHIRNRAGDGTLSGLVIDDQRDPEVAFTYVADRAAVLETPDRTLLVMRDGVLQRLKVKTDALSIVQYEAYAFDLSDLNAQDAAPVYRPSERSTTELIWPDGKDDYTSKNLGRFRAELHDRLAQPLLPLAFAVIAFLCLGEARSTRQGRSLAILAAIVAAMLMRGILFGTTSASVRSPVAAVLVYAIPLAVIGGGLWMIARDRSLSLPAPLERLLDAISDLIERLQRRFLRRQPWGAS